MSQTVANLITAFQGYSQLSAKKLIIEAILDQVSWPGNILEMGSDSCEKNRNGKGLGMKDLHILFQLS
jgi:hypothetical protein